MAMGSNNSGTSENPNKSGSAPLPGILRNLRQVRTYRLAPTWLRSLRVQMVIVLGRWRSTHSSGGSVHILSPSHSTRLKATAMRRATSSAWRPHDVSADPLSPPTLHEASGGICTSRATSRGPGASKRRLADHGGAVFALRPHNTRLCDAFYNRFGLHGLTLPPPSSWALEAVLARAPNSASRPDGLPYAAWRSAGSRAASLLSAMFNASAMVRLPKGERLGDTQFFAPSSPPAPWGSRTAPTK